MVSRDPLLALLPIWQFLLRWFRFFVFLPLALVLGLALVLVVVLGRRCFGVGP